MEEKLNKIDLPAWTLILARHNALTRIFSDHGNLLEHIWRKSNCDCIDVVINGGFVQRTGLESSKL